MKTYLVTRTIRYAIEVEVEDDQDAYDAMDLALDTDMVKWDDETLDDTVEEIEGYDI